jgi:nitrogen-specific signal transduction histidine kinase
MTQSATPNQNLDAKRPGWARVSRQLPIILATTFLLVVVFVALLTYRYTQLADQFNRSVTNLQNTFELNQELRSGIQEQINMLHRQLEDLNLAFERRFGQLNYSIGAKQSRYLTLDIGEKERLAVESIRAVHSELGVESMQIYAQLRRGERVDAVRGIGRVEQLGDRLDREFQLLNRLQIEKLQAVQREVTLSLRNARIAIVSLAGVLVIILGVVTLILRRRVLRPLSSLLLVSEQIRQGNFAARAPADRNDELGSLSHSLNFMAESLEDNYSALKREVKARDQLLEALQSELGQAGSVRALSQLIRGAAHELNNPLTAISGFAELQKMKVASTRRDTDEIRILDDILSQSERCRRIIANLLQVAQPAKSQLSVTGVNAVLEPVLQLREYEMKVHNIRLNREYDDDDPPVQVDAYQLRQLALTLLVAVDGALRARFTSGTVTVKTSRAETLVWIEITGRGATPRGPEAWAPEPGVSGDSRKVLPLASALAQQLGAEVSASESDDASFSVSLPMGSSQAPETAADESGITKR